MLARRIPTIFVLAVLISYIESEVQDTAGSIGDRSKRHGHGGHHHGGGGHHHGGGGHHHGGGGHHHGGGKHHGKYEHGGGGGGGGGGCNCGGQVPVVPRGGGWGQLPVQPGTGGTIVLPPAVNNHYYVPQPGQAPVPPKSGDIHIHVDGGGGGGGGGIGGGSIDFQLIMAKIAALLSAGGGINNNPGNGNLNIFLQSFQQLLTGNQLQALLMQGNVDINALTSQIITILSGGSLNVQSLITQLQSLFAQYNIILSLNTQTQDYNIGGGGAGGGGFSWTIQQKTY